MRRQQRKQKHENAEAESEEVEGTFTEIIVNDDVETTGVASEGHLEFHTVNEEAGHIVLHVSSDIHRERKR